MWTHSAQPQHGLGAVCSNLIHLAVDTDRVEALLSQQIVQKLYMVPSGCEDQCGAALWHHLLEEPQQGSRFVFLPAGLPISETQNL